MPKRISQLDTNSMVKASREIGRKNVKESSMTNNPKFQMQSNESARYSGWTTRQQIQLKDWAYAALEGISNLIDNHFKSESMRSDSRSIYRKACY